MLSLTRRPNECIRINDDILVKVLCIKGNQVQIGVAAPKDVAIWREELYLKGKAQQDAMGAKPEKFKQEVLS